jgi:hypothetical protein
MNWATAHRLDWLLAERNSLLGRSSRQDTRRSPSSTNRTSTKCEVRTVTQAVVKSSAMASCRRIDFDMAIEGPVRPKSYRVKLVMTGNLLQSNTTAQTETRRQKEVLSPQAAANTSLNVLATCFVFVRPRQLHQKLRRNVWMRELK